MAECTMSYDQGAEVFPKDSKQEGKRFMMRKSMLLIGLLVIPTLAFAHPGQGQGRNDGTGGNRGPMGSGHCRPSPPIPAPVPGVPKDPQCLKDCRDTLKVCMADAREELRPCLDTCQPLVDAARVVCQAAPHSSECEAAREAARNCIHECREEARPMMEACAEEGRGCVDQCPVITDVECLADCREVRETCMHAQWDALLACAAECRGPLDAAIQTCRTDRTSEECKAAQAAARDCLRACNEAAREGVSTCAESFRTCASRCANAEPTEE